MTLSIKNLGSISYDDGLALMMDLHQQRAQNLISDQILLLEHTPVITKGRRLHDSEMLLHPKLTERGVELRNADRGGLLTYHGPGQIVVYFICRFAEHFEGISAMVHSIEKTLQDFCKELGLETRLDPEHPGVWVAQVTHEIDKTDETAEKNKTQYKKIASIGLRVSDGVTRHGISFNISTDLDVYRYFDPCGMTGDSTTTLEKVLNEKISQEHFWRLGEKLAQKFVKAL